ncbi:type II toxin-antitoxin system TacA family antitoxin [Microvirga pudoricolor]|uniref:type II toxin-antitoxin system TacA family antitoxin n=1 Tax=Microvirga pudoricolor TaxID=2778729 RepID=UPI001950ABEF|nr:DUF1778 domain-containing protein [Microvirga pudoricolor]MBM6592787.1 DUF1778 domain-containing protein [Microvirga pudoricolor]
MAALQKTTAARSRREATVNIRIATETRDLIDSAASALGQTRSQFLVESARRQAIDVLLDQRFFVMDSDQYEAFLAILDSAPPPNEKLENLMKKKASWEA